MKHKKRDRWEESNATMTKGRHRTHRVEKGSDRTVWLSVYLLFGFQIEQNRLIDIDKAATSASTAASTAAAMVASTTATASTAASAAAAAVSKNKKKYHG